MHTEPVMEKGIADADIGQCPNCGDVGFGMCAVHMLPVRTLL
jgi:hypothetical protein